MKMHATKLRTLEAAGWVSGSVAGFLDLSPEESAFIEIKLSLSRYLREMREKKHMSQAALAKATGSSQSRVAKAEAGDSSVSLDLIVKSLIAVGASRKELARAIAPRAAVKKVPPVILARIERHTTWLMSAWLAAKLGK